jgi:hypothetical protein
MPSLLGTPHNNIVGLNKPVYDLSFLLLLKINHNTSLTTVNGKEICTLTHEEGSLHPTLIPHMMYNYP